MKQIICRSVAILLLVMCVFGQMTSAVSETVSRNPLIDPHDTPVAKTPQRYTNILLLGVDFGFQGYLGSGSYFKKTLEDCHTDAVMVVSINMTTSEVNLISLPRDTVTYVPGVRGIYKLNAAFNCADTVGEGFERICNAASWLLGGIPIDHYCAVDMAAMIALGDFIGGVDIEVDMNYTGHSDRNYYKGMQHLDGVGITDYLRARKNATVEGNDIGRTGRQRRMMTAIFEKVKSNSGLIKSGWDYATSGEINFFTDMSLAKVLNLLNKVKNADSIGSHVITGEYRTALQGWNFTFTDQANRIEVIREVYGIEVEEIPYVSYQYTDWLMEEGMRSAQYIAVAREVLDYAATLPQLTQEQQDAVTQLTNDRNQAILAFETAADSMTKEDQNVMVSSRRTLLESANRAADLLAYPEAGKLLHGIDYWYKDPSINEYQMNWQ